MENASWSPMEEDLEGTYAKIRKKIMLNRRELERAGENWRELERIGENETENMKMLCW